MNKEEKEYELAVGMYKQYREDVAKVDQGLNIYQMKTLELLENNFRQKEKALIIDRWRGKEGDNDNDYQNELKWWQKLIGAIKNRRD